MLELLTKKEQEVVNLLMKGTTPKKIAREMRTSRKLIHLHLSRIRKKFSVHTTIEIMRCTGETLAYPKHPIKLTPRGAEVFRLSLSGVNTTRIARCLKISRSGVRRHREKMLMANGCNSMLELVAKYYGTYAE
mgnify:CR=1 FL=1